MSADSGFVLVDAVVGAVILGMAGTAAIALTVGLLTNGDRLLDRSLLLVNLESRAYEAVMVGGDNLAQLPPSGDGAFTYTARLLPDDEKRDSGLLVPVAVEANDLLSGELRESLELLAAKRGTLP